MTLEQINARIAELAGMHRSIINEAIKLEGGMAELKRLAQDLQVAEGMPENPGQ